VDATFPSPCSIEAAGFFHQNSNNKQRFFIYWPIFPESFVNFSKILTGLQ
jgi:hypothetical protein